MTGYVARIRERVGHDYVLFPGAVACVLDAAGRLLVADQRDLDGWQLPGGVVEPDEHPADAVAREAREELGVDVVVRDVVGVFGGPEFHFTYAGGDDAGFVTTAFAVEVPAGVPEPDGHELTGLRWLAREEATAPPLAPWVRAVAEAAFAWHERRARSSAFEVCVDANDPARLRPFWASALGYDEHVTDEGAVDLVDPAGVRPTVWFQRVPEPKATKNRVHLDVWIAADAEPERRAALLAAGGRVLDEQERVTVLADPEGNELCLCW